MSTHLLMRRRHFKHRASQCRVFSVKFCPAIASLSSGTQKMSYRQHKFLPCSSGKFRIQVPEVDCRTSPVCFWAGVSPLCCLERSDSRLQHGGRQEDKGI